MLTEAHYRDQGSDAVLELTVLGGVDERVDDAVGQRQHGSEFVVPVCLVDSDAAEEQNIEDKDWTETDDVSTAHRQCRDNCITSSLVYHRASHWIHLQETN